MIRYTCLISVPLVSRTSQHITDMFPDTDLYVLKSSSLSLKPLLRSMLIPLRASSASFTRPGFSPSTSLPAAGFAGSAIEIFDTGDEELKAAARWRDGRGDGRTDGRARGGRARCLPACGGVWLVYFTDREKESRPVAQFGVNAGEGEETGTDRFRVTAG